jgi:hypothetical protein
MAMGCRTWETANGLEPDVNDAAGDADQDGMTNLRNSSPAPIPRNSASVLRVDILSGDRADCYGASRTRPTPRLVRSVADGGLGKA